MSIVDDAKAQFGSGEYTLAEYKDFLTQVLRAEIFEIKTTAIGETYEYCAIADRRAAGREMSLLKGWIEEAEAKAKSGKGKVKTTQYVPGTQK